MTKQMDLDRNGTMDWFFNEYVYGTEMPTYRFEYQLSGDGATISARITQSGVRGNFKMLVPVYVDDGKGGGKRGSARILGNTTVDLPVLKVPNSGQAAARAAREAVPAVRMHTRQ